MQSGLAWREPTSGEKFICIRGASRLEMLQDSIRFGLPWYTFSRNFARPNAITELRVHVCSMRIFGGRPLKSSLRTATPDITRHSTTQGSGLSRRWDCLPERERNSSKERSSTFEERGHQSFRGSKRDQSCQSESEMSVSVHSHRPSLG